jgi:hypothetical protein
MLETEPQVSPRCKRDLGAEHLSLGEAVSTFSRAATISSASLSATSRKARDSAPLHLDLANQLVQLAREPRGERLAEVAVCELEGVIVTSSSHPH